MKKFNLNFKKTVLFVSAALFVFSVIIMSSGVVRAAAPTITWTPSDTSKVSDAGTGITAVFSQALFSDSSCSTALASTDVGSIARLRIGSVNGRVISTTNTMSGLTLLLDPNNDLNDGTYYTVITGNNKWFYQDTEDSQCKSGDSEAMYFVVDTKVPTIDSPVSFRSDSSRGTEWAKEGDTVTVEFSLSEKIEHDVFDILYQVGGGSEYSFLFTEESSIESGECKEVSTHLHSYQCNYVIAAQDEGLFKVKIVAFTDGANNQGIGGEYNEEGVMVDTTVPSVIETSHYTSYADNSYLFSGEIDGGTYKESETIYTKVLFSEDMAHTAKSGNNALPRITYSIGGRHRIYSVVSRSETLESGECKPNHITETDEYACMYTVASRSDEGEFRVIVDTASIDPAGNSIGEEYVHVITAHPVFDTTSPNRPTGLDLLTEHDTGQSDTDNLTSITRGLTIQGCAETGSTVTLYRDRKEVPGTVTADGPVDGDIVCTGTNVSSFFKDIDLGEGDHLITATVVDVVEHTSASSAPLRITVDETVPVLESATLANFEKTETTLLFSEPVFTKEEPDVSDFVIQDSSIGSVSVTSVTGATGTATPKETVTLTHGELSLLGDIALSYIPGSDSDKRISDEAGNVLEVISESSPFNVTAFGPLTVALHSSSDTGAENDDRITNFEIGSTISFVVSRTTGNFSRGKVDLYKVGMEKNDRIGGQSISGSGSGNITVRVPRGQFFQERNQEEGITIIASFTPSASGAVEGAPSEPLVIYYDTDEPQLTEAVAVSSLSNNLLPEYTFITDEDGAIRYEGSCRPTETEAVIGENVILLGELREGVYSNCRIYVTDVAGNESSALRVSKFEIDITEPTISSVSLIRLEGTKTRIIFDEPVYTESTPQPQDFFVVGKDGIEQIGISIEGLEVTADDADNSFILNHNEVDTTGTIFLSYSKSNNLITDKAGNELDYVSDMRVSVAPFVRLTLDSRDDTGKSNDGVTHFNDSIASFIATITTGSFATDDVVKMYEEGAATALETHTITASQNGTRQIVLEIPVNSFTPDTSFVLEATLTRADTEEEGGRGMPLTIVYDTTAPTIDIFGLSEGAEMSKVVNAFDDETGTTDWKYTKIDEAAVCNVSAFTRGVSSYTEYDDIVLRSGDNGKKVCFASTDNAGNTGYKATPVITGIDNEMPTVSVVALGGDRDFLKVTLSEPVYTDAVPDVSEFSLYRRSSRLSIFAVEGLASFADSATDTFIIRFSDTVTASDRLTLSYHRHGSANKYIKDAAGNALRPFNRVSVMQPPSVVLDLSTDDDTGSSATDRITSFEGADATLTVSTGSSAVFSNGDLVTIYGGDDFNTVLTTIAVGTDILNAVSVSSFDIAVSVGLFTEGENIIAATHRPEGAAAEGELGDSLTIIYDSLAPVLTEKTAIVTPTNDDTPEYVFISDEAGALRYGGDCSSGTTAVREGDNTVIFRALPDGLHTDCALYVTDIAGNESDGFIVSSFTIDTEVPVVTVDSPDTVVAKSKVVVADDDDAGVTTWKYKAVGRSESCTRSRMTVGAKDYTEEENLVLVDEQYNGRRVCFASTDEAGNTGYGLSEIIDGIDSTGPNITVRNPSDAYEAQKTVSATDDVDDTTVWAYKVLTALIEVCEASQMTSGTTTSYTEGIDIPFVTEEDNGKRVCFSATDSADNITYRESAVIINIDASAPTVIFARTADLYRSRTEVTLSEPVYASSLPPAGNFRIVIDAVEYPATEILDISRSAEAMRTSFTVVHASVRYGSSVSLKYIGSNAGTIVDRAGNDLEGFSDLPITATKFVSLVLSADDDTGDRQDDNITTFDGNEVTLAIALTTDTFRNGDKVRVYNRDTIIGTYAVSNVLSGAFDAAGQTSFTINVPRRLFVRDGVTVLHATYIPIGGIEGDRGNSLSITYDATGPDVTVTEPLDGFLRSKAVSAADTESDDILTMWLYKKISGTERCDSVAMRVDAEEYVEGTEVLFGSESDNDTKACFSASDIAGNTVYEESAIITDVDVTRPEITSAVVTNITRTETKVVFSEKVYAPVAPAAGDFLVVAGGDIYPVTDISNLAAVLSGAGTEITLTHTPISEGASVTLRYIKRTESIIDRAGNELVNVTGKSVSNTPFTFITLNREDDTGTDSTDDITKFGSDNLVSFTVSLTSGLFTEGDRVQVYRSGSSTALKSVVIGSGGSSRFVNAHGQNSFNFSLSKSVFAEGSNTLYAVHTPFRGPSSHRGAEFTLVYDKTGPSVAITGPSADPSREKTISAVDGEDEDTTWVSKVLDNASACSASAMASGVVLYDEGDILTFTDEHADKVICFAATDIAGNTSYRSSGSITNIDSVSPTVSSAVVLNLDRTRTRVLFSEPIHASPGIFSPSDFRIRANGVPYSVTGIENLPSTAAITRDALVNELVLIHPSMVSDQITITLSYRRGSKRILDAAGNPLENFVGFPVTVTSFVNLTLAPEDDTGISYTDGYTRFDGSDVSIRVSLTSKSAFSESDTIVFYSRGDHASSLPSELSRVTVSSLLRGGINAAGSGEFVTILPISTFQRNAATWLSAAYIPIGQFTGERGAEILIVRDDTAPNITVKGPGTDSAQTKVISASDADTEETFWAYRQTASDISCNADTMSSGTEDYTENTDLSFSDEEDNDTKVCFSSTDLAGNAVYQSSGMISGIDTTIPTVSEMVVTDENRITVTMSESVYSSSGPDVNDFIIYVNDIDQYPDSIAGLSKDSAFADTMFVIISDEVLGADDTITVSYIGSTQGVDGEFIRDLSGRILQPFERMFVTARKAVSLVLDESDDTGADSTDGITNFGRDSTVSFTARLSGTNTFENRDVVRLYRDEETRALKTVTVKGTREDNEFTFTVPKSKFTEGSFTLYVSYKPYRGTGSLTGSRIELLYDIDEPGITVIGSKEALSASDTDSGETFWAYRQIASDISCNADTMSSDAVAYTEGTDLTFDGEEDNDTKVCFSSTDLAGNVAYQSSGVISGIDATAPNIVITDPVVGSAQSKTVSAVITDANAKEDRYRYIVTRSSICDAAVIADNTEGSVYTSGRALTFSSEDANGSYVCFRAEDQKGNVSFVASAIIDGIDITSAMIDGTPIVTSTNVNSQYAKEGDVLELTFVVSEALASAPEVMLAGQTVTAVADGNTYTAAYTVIDKTSQGSVVYNIGTITDTQGNSFDPDAGISDVVVDTVVPVVIVMDPADGATSRKTVSAADSESGLTVWNYKQTSADTACDVDTMASGTVSYTETTNLIFDNEGDNGTKVCFFSADSAGNIGYAVSGLIEDIDSVVPTVTSAFSLDVNRTRTKVTVSEKVRATGTLSPRDFAIIVNGVPYPATHVSDLGYTSAGETSLTVTHLPISADVSAVLAYTQGAQRITDTAGNVLKSFSNLPIFTTRFIRISLDETDDTGADQTDGITRFDGDEVTLVFTLTAGSFSNGDTVDLYKRGVAGALRTVLISDGIAGAVDAAGEALFVVTLPRDVFGDTTTFYAVYTPFNDVAGDRGTEFTIIYSTDVPNVTVSNPGSGPARVKIISASDADSDMTVWAYRQIASGADCDAGTMASGTSVYTEGTDLTFTREKDNDTRVCFAVTGGIAGNTVYAVSEVIEGIDTDAPVVRVVVPDVKLPHSAKSVYATDDDNSSVVWTYTQLDALDVCGDGSMNSADSYTEGEILSFSDEADNGTKVCFAAEDAVGNISYAASAVLMSIDTTAPVITVTEPDSDSVRTRQVWATGSNEEGVLWAYVKIDAGRTCALDVLAGDVMPYSEGSPVTFGIEDDGIKVCFVAADDAGNVAYASSTVMVVGEIDETPPVIIVDPITVFVPDTVKEERESPEVAELARIKVVKASDTDTDETVWTYRQTASDIACDVGTMASGTSAYTEGTDIAFDSEDDNNTKVCFSAQDAEGNTAYLASGVIRGIDAVAPAVSFAAFLDVDRTRTKVLLTEEARTTGLLSPSDFGVEIDGVSYPAVKVSDVTSVSSEETFFVVTHPSVNFDVSAALVYTPGIQRIVDVVGHPLDSFSSPIFDTQFVLVSLDENDDTGSSQTDGITQLDDDTVTLMLTLNAGLFSNGDTVQIFRKGVRKALETVLISNGIADAIDAAGEISFTIELPRDEFDDVTTFFVVYTPVRGDTGEKGPMFSVHHSAGPQITVIHPSSGFSQSKVIRASDADPEGETEWEYKVIKGGAICDVEEMNSRTSPYQEGSGLVFRSEKANGYKICFSSANEEDGSVSYAESRIMKGIDGGAPSVVSAAMTGRNMVTMTFDEAVLGDASSAKNVFQLIKNNGAVLQTASVRGLSETSANIKFTLTFSGGLLPGDTLTLSYLGGDVVDRAGNALTEIVGVEVVIPPAMVPSSVVLPSSGGRRPTTGADKPIRPLSTASSLTPESLIFYPVTSTR